MPPQVQADVYLPKPWGERKDKKWISFYLWSLDGKGENILALHMANNCDTIFLFVEKVQNQMYESLGEAPTPKRRHCYTK